MIYLHSNRFITGPAALTPSCAKWISRTSAPYLHNHVAQFGLTQMAFINVDTSCRKKKSTSMYTKQIKLSQFTTPVSVSLPQSPRMTQFHVIESATGNCIPFTLVESKTETETDDHVPAHDLGTLFFARFSCTHCTIDRMAVLKDVFIFCSCW